MPRVKPPQLGLYEGEDGMLNMDAPPYPLPYEWGNAYYAFTYGPARHIIVNCYSDMSPGSTQHTWLEGELVRVDRARTPWVILTLHVPLYNTFSLHHHDPQIFAARDHLEPLMIKYNVNVVLNGHIHAYQRTHMVAANVTTPEGTMHITIG
jgi:acid phosphatase type 7